MKLTEERVIPKLMNPKNGILLEHKARYRFASQFVRGKVLDIACGVGYGAEILLRSSRTDHIENIVGVDIDEMSIQYAREHYSSPRTRYIKGDVLSPDLKAELGTFDTIITMETIEHLEDDEAFVSNLYSLLDPEGTLIISTPFGRGRGIPCTNPFHYHQYKEEEFLDLLKMFRTVENYHQIDETIEKPIPGKKYYLMVAVCKGKR